MARLQALAGRSGGVAVEIHDADGSRVFAEAAGAARSEHAATMTVETPCHVASVGKTFTAVLVLQLWERGAFDSRGLDMPVADTGFLAPEVVSRLHRLDGRSHGERITLRQLLTHTAGLRDAVVDGAAHLAARDGGAAPDSLIGQLLSRAGQGPEMPSPAWVPWQSPGDREGPAGTLNFYLDTPGMADPALSLPGTRFHYSDTGFVLLALMVEHLAGQPLHVLLRERIFTPLEMHRSYLAYRDDPPLSPGRLEEADVWLDDKPLLAGGVDLSFDWGGGGIVATMGDLVRFLRGLIQGRLFTRPRTLAAMLDWQVPEGLRAPRTGVGLGIFRTQHGRHTLIGHGGAWGTKMVYDPALSLFFAGTLNRAQAPEDWHAQLLDCWSEAA